MEITGNRHFYTLVRSKLAEALVYATAFSAMAVATLVNLGWLLHNSTLIQINPAFSPMQFNTALLFMISGFSLVLLVQNKPVLSAAGGFFVCIAGIATISQYWIGVSLGIDEFFIDYYLTTAVPAPGRMSANTALCFIFMGTALALRFFWKRIGITILLSLLLSTVVLGLGFIALVGYATSMVASYGYGFTGMAVHTAIIFTLMGASLFVYISSAKVEEKNGELYQQVCLALFCILLFFLSIVILNAEQRQRIEQVIDEEGNGFEARVLRRALGTNRSLSRLAATDFLSYQQWRDDSAYIAEVYPHIEMMRWLDRPGYDEFVEYSKSVSQVTRKKLDPLLFNRASEEEIADTLERPLILLNYPLPPVTRSKGATMQVLIDVDRFLSFAGGSLIGEDFSIELTVNGLELISQADQQTGFQWAVTHKVWGSTWALTLVPSKHFLEKHKGQVENLILTLVFLLLVMLTLTQRYYFLAKIQTKESKRLAEIDSLTGLANRYLFEESFKIAVANNRRNGSFLSLIIFDLDDFKLVNDNFGHLVGDKLLVKLSNRISSCLRGNELFARLGGDEFAIVLINQDKIHNSTQVINRIRQVLQLPFTIDAHEIRASISVGIAVANEPGIEPQELMKQADIAMYRSKHQGRGLSSFFEAAMQESLERQLKIETGLTEALRNEEFTLVYQPIIKASSLEARGYEALIRWNSPTGPILPDEFIQAAEQGHKMIEIGRWVIKTAIKQLSQWQKQSLSADFIMSINLSATQLADDTLPEFILDCCQAVDISPSFLEFELTETALINKPELKIKFLQRLRGLGCKIALDDFGTGFSSVSHLKFFPIDTVKLDKIIMPDDESEEQLLFVALVQMLLTLGKEIVAEGVETEAQKDLCQSLGITNLQGYYFSKPLRAEECLDRTNYIP